MADVWSVFGFILIACVNISLASNYVLEENLQEIVENIVEKKNEHLIERISKLEHELHERKLKELKTEQKVNELQSKNEQQRDEIKLLKERVENLDKYYIKDDLHKESLNSKVNINSVGASANTSDVRDKTNSRGMLQYYSIGKESPQHLKRISRVGEAESIAFSVYLSHYVQHMAPGHVIKCDSAVLNDGNAYNTHTGIFTVPVTGTYVFNFFIESHFPRRTDVVLLLDGALQTSAIVVPNNQAVMGGNSVILRALQGQSVWLEAKLDADGSVVSEPAYRLTTFSGYLLY